MLKPATGRLCAFIMIIYIAIYYATGTAHKNHDELMPAGWLIFMAVLLYFPIEDKKAKLKKELQKAFSEPESKYKKVTARQVKKRNKQDG